MPTGNRMRAFAPSSVGVPPGQRVIRLTLWGVGGVALSVVALAMGTPAAAVIGVVAGALAAVIVQRLQLAWFAAGIRRSEGVDWIDRVPTSLAALRRPLRAVEHQLSQHSAALDDATARERLRDVAVDALELEVDALDRALGESRADMAEVLGALDRALASSSPQAVLRRELVELRELVRLNVYAELPNDTVPVGDVLAEVVAGGVPRGRVEVNGLLPTVTAPSPLLEALVRAMLGHALAVGEHVVVFSGVLDGAMVALEVAGPARPEPTIHLAVARRVVSILGGDLQVKQDRLLVVIPARFVPGLRAITPIRMDWDLPEAM